MAGKPYRRIDWDEILKWLEMGYPIQDLAGLVGLGVRRLGTRARLELDEERHNRWKYLVRHNMHVEKAPCGTPTAYARHLYLKEPLDDACREAEAKAQRLRRFEKEMEVDSVEYKVDSRWSKKWKRQVYVVERHMSSRIRLVASYRDAEAARDVVNVLNSNQHLEN